MNTTSETKKSIDDFVKLLIKIPDSLRDNAYFTINGMILSYDCEKLKKEKAEQPRNSLENKIV